jgi:hypothetical protein
MTLILIVWFRKYDQNQDFDSDDENLINKHFKVFRKKVTFALFKFFLINKLKTNFRVSTKILTNTLIE